MGPFHLTVRVKALEIGSRGAAATRRLGQRLGEAAHPGDVYLLIGELGSGKTCLVQGIARGLQVAAWATSPSFVFVKEYQGRLPLYHIDLYRLPRKEEAESLGLDRYLYGHGVAVVEWADQALELMPPEHLLINLSYVSPRKRALHFEARGERYAQILYLLAQQGIA